jgi:antitoxin VapB
MATRTRLFTSNRTQAVRLPKDVAFPPEVEEVEIIRQGNARLLVPKGQRWDDFFDRGPHVDEDFMSDWVQLPPDERDSL